MRTLKWDPLFDPEEETSIAIAWISFPALPPNFFVKEAVFSLAAAVGKPLQVDLAMRNQTRPSCARVKVEVDLLSDFPKRINVGMRKKLGEVCETWIRIKYDYVPKYCKNCKIQGHNEDECFVIHPELYPKPERKNENQETTNKVEKKEGAQGKFISRKEEQSKQNGKGEIKEQKNTKEGGWTVQGKQIWTRKMVQQEKQGITTDNQFGALNENEDTRETQIEQQMKGTEMNTGSWVEKAFKDKNIGVLGSSTKDGEEENTLGSGTNDREGVEVKEKEKGRASSNSWVERSPILKDRGDERDASSSNMGSGYKESEQGDVGKEKEDETG
ncbi:uncharacterized protein [Solanum tuberosum]|uniref:uncharacterized protein n=1 Tax=Solanum tuberosum TaxID=4113 RepID=UPI00073A0F66|nr:PREDICTED: uncharacterized protein LOC107062862 [Solanum tuberosum]